jgi:excisionase family DNA binding protein
MSAFKDELLASCTPGAEQIDADCSEVSPPHCADDASAGIGASADSSALPAPNCRERPGSPRGPPWGATPAAVAPIQPIAVPPLKAAMLIGGSRSTVYRLLAAGKLRAVKRGGATLVLTNSIYEYMASLPPATFGRHQQNTAA